jgi:hypothetical protein
MKEKLEMQAKLDDQITKLNRATRQNKELETNNKILSADNIQLKTEIFKANENV